MIEPVGRVINCAHRGASAHAPENTLAALDMAIALGADMAEVDVQPTADGRLVIFHDDELGRTTDGTGPLAERTLDELRRLDAGAWFDAAWAGQRIPTLDEVLELARGRLLLNLELKSRRWDEAGLLELTQALDRHRARGRVLVTGFDADLIDELRDREPHLRLGYILGRGAVPGWAFSAKVGFLSAERSLVDAAFLEFAVAASKSVHAWTVNDPDDMVHLMDLGVDGVITDDPQLFPRKA